MPPRRRRRRQRPTRPLGSPHAADLPRRGHVARRPGHERDGDRRHLAPHAIGPRGRPRRPAGAGPAGRHPRPAGQAARGPPPALVPARHLDARLRDLRGDDRQQLVRGALGDDRPHVGQPGGDGDRTGRRHVPAGGADDRGRARGHLRRRRPAREDLSRPARPARSLRRPRARALPEDPAARVGLQSRRAPARERLPRRPRAVGYRGHVRSDPRGDGPPASLAARQGAAHPRLPVDLRGGRRRARRDGHGSDGMRGDRPGARRRHAAPGPAFARDPDAARRGTGG